MKSPFNGFKYISVITARRKGESDADLAARTEQALARWNIKAADGETTGKPSIDHLRRKVTKAIQQDDRFDDNGHGFKEGSPEDNQRDPYCVDLLVPDDDGKMHAIIHSPNPTGYSGKTFKHGFEYDGNEVTMDDGDPQEVEPTTVYARQYGEARKAFVVQAEEAGHAFHGNQYSQEAYERDEMNRHVAHMRDIESQPLKDRKEAENDVHEHMKNPEGFAERAQWMLNGDYGKGAQMAAQRIADSPRMNREAAMSQMVGAYEHNSPGKHTIAAWKRLTPDEQKNLHTHMSGVFKDYDDEKKANVKASDYSLKQWSAENHLITAGGPGSGPHKQFDDARDAANAQSKTADKLSAKANKTDDPEDHHAALKAQYDASVMHRNVAGMAKAAGDKEEQRTHEKMAEEHDKQRNLHAKFFQTAPAKASDAADVIAVHCREVGVVFAAETKWEQDKPVQFQWMPGGVTTVCAGYDGGAIDLTVECDEQTAAIVQASFQEWMDRYPKQKPFGCVEHREEEAAIHPSQFVWKDDPEPGVYCTGTPTELGARNVNGRIHRSWSPSFTTDAEYNKAKEKNGVLVFPEGVRGSKSNPAKITGVAFSVGSLTNKPAFKNILPVRAKQANPQPEPKPAESTEAKTQTMKVKFIRAHGSYAVGAEADLDVTHAAVTAGDAMAPAAADIVIARDREVASMKEEKKQQGITTIKARIADAKKRMAIAPKDETVEAKALERFEKGAPLDLVCELIDGMQNPQTQVLASRLTRPFNETGGRVEILRMGIREGGDAYVKAREPMNQLIRTGKVKEALELSVQASAIYKDCFHPVFSQGGDFALRDAVTAADVTDPDSQVGTLATGIILMRNLGFLKRKLNFMDKLTTDLRNEPAKFGQPLLTRYITPPGVLTFVPGVGYTSDATTIANAGGNTVQTGQTYQTSGTKTLSSPSSTDVSVNINQHKAVEIFFATDKLGSTARNLFAEQYSAQLYSLAETVNIYVLATLFNANWTGIVKQMSLGTFALPTMVTLKNRMTLAKIPDVGRFALLHSVYHDNLLTDTNLLTAKAILALINKDDSAFDSGEVPSLFGIKPLESQLASFKSGVQTDPTVNANTGAVDFAGPQINQIGFAGNMSSGLFVARVPQDYTQVLEDIPATAAIQIVTEPDSGLSVMVAKFVDHGKAEVHQRVALMYGAAQGDPRQGIILTP